MSVKGQSGSGDGQIRSNAKANKSVFICRVLQTNSTMRYMLASTWLAECCRPPPTKLYPSKFRFKGLHRSSFPECSDLVKEKMG